MKRSLTFKLLLLTLISFGIFACSENTDEYNSEGRVPVEIGGIYVKAISADELTRSTDPYNFREGDILTITATTEDTESHNYISGYIFNESEGIWVHDGASDILCAEEISTNYSFRFEINKGRWTNIQDNEVALHQSDYIAGPGEIRDGMLHSAALVPLTHQFICVEVTIEKGAGWQRAGGFTPWIEQSTIKFSHPGAADVVLPNVTAKDNKSIYTAILKPGSVPRPNGNNVLLSLDPNVAGESIIHLRYNTLMGTVVKTGQQISLSVSYDYETGLKNGWAKISEWKVQ